MISKFESLRNKAEVHTVCTVCQETKKLGILQWDTVHEFGKDDRTVSIIIQNVEKEQQVSYITSFLWRNHDHESA